MFSIRKASTSFTDVCIFLSHIRIDKKYAIAISEYIMNAGYDVYIDINDEDLQRAVMDEDPYKVTECIEEDISGCSHILCIVSNTTVNSWWVPYEIGYSKKSNRRLLH